MKVENSGWYHTRDGRLAEVVVGPKICGYIVGTVTCPLFWAEDGEGESLSHKADLIEYLGKERPKQKKTIKIAPALMISYGKYCVTGNLYDSEDKAKADCGRHFVRWLVDTPYEISVEVEE